MARKALLIGTEKYQDGFKTLKSAPHDVEALAGLLRHPEVGGFEPDNVQVLLDRESADLSTQIETWYLQHSKDDFALLFIAEHGVKDADRKLHFAAANTRKVGEGLITTTAVAASNLSNWMQKSKSKRQLVILNCCFSGAFGDLVPMDEGAIDVEEVLGAEGRVVMTSTTSMDYAFERQNGELSVYGHYFVEGLRTGAAAIHGNDEITVDELHQYVSRKVQEEAPAMVPRLFAKGEGHRLRIARVAIGDPAVKYRKEVERIIQEDGDEIDEVFSRPILEELRAKLQLDLATAAEIEKAVLEPILQRNAKRQKYREFFARAVQHRYPFGEREQKRIAEYRKMLGLGDEEYMALERSVDIPKPTVQVVTEQPIVKPKRIEPKPIPPAPQPQNTIDAILLESEKEVDYRKLRDLLKAKKWEEADEETLAVMLQASDRESLGWLDANALENFPCKDLRTIDRLWVEASNGHFGFSVQKKIWEECGSPKDTGKNWDRFCVKVGWQNSDASAYVSYTDLKKNPSLSPIGELPRSLPLDGRDIAARELPRSLLDVADDIAAAAAVVLGFRYTAHSILRYFSFLAQRLVNCSTPAFQPDHKS
jgi:GUN4-like/Caspase domain